MPALLRSVAVVRFRIWLATALAFGALVAGLLRAQVDEEKKRDQSDETETRAASTDDPSSLGAAVNPSMIGRSKSAYCGPY